SGEAVCEFNGGGVSVGPGREVRELLGLFRCSFGKATASVANVDDEKTAQRIEVLLALAVPNVVALTLHDDGNTVAVFHYGLPRHRHPQVVFGFLLKFGLV